MVGDLLNSQLLSPALVDALLTPERIDAVLARHGQGLCESVGERLHASASDGVVIHVHDALGW